ncbi:MAG: hypothetical protein FWB96_03305 [Defluviitaleaceae bacterium]|nr:hypothetical protein [Defluviitaleaceae bacterium]MCL2261706.1 hypothetical protein [Defluviitaleaceae bacterium]
MPQYRNVLAWLETEYLSPAIEITKRVVTSTDIDETTPDTGNYAELKDLERLLEKALTYVRRHQN